MHLEEAQNVQAKNFGLEEKKTVFMFIATEIAIYISQILMFFFVAVLTSNLLRDEKLLATYMEQKINGNTVFDVIATMIAIAATLGVISGITKALPASSVLKLVADEVLSEAPRTAYVFGSSVAGTLLAAALFVHNNPQIQSAPSTFWLFGAFILGTVGFLYGCAFSYAFKHKSHITQERPKSL